MCRVCWCVKWCRLPVCWVCALALTIAAGPTMRYMDETACSLHNPDDYINSVLRAPRTGAETAGAQ